MEGLVSWSRFRRRPVVRHARLAFYYPAGMVWAFVAAVRDPEVRRGDLDRIPMPTSTGWRAVGVAALVWAPLVLGVVWLLW